MNPRSEPTLADVAALAGVSLTTVSRVLNSRGYLSQETKDKVASAIASLGYRPNQVARALHGMRTQTIGLIVPTVALPFFGELAVEVENALAEHGYRILICNSLGKAEREREYLNLLVGNRVDGIISGAHNEDLEEYHDIRMPLVTIDRALSPAVPNVRCDNHAAGREATERLLTGGARRPALLTSSSGPQNLRETGYREALSAKKITPVVLTVPFHTPVEQRQAMVDERLDSVAELIDAVFATDDLAAAEVLEWARTRGLSVPEHLRVIGFDGTSAIRRALPGLTTVRQPIEAIAREAVRILLGQIETARRQRRRSAGGGQDGALGNEVRPVYGPVEFPATIVEGWTA
ncbi:LacI family DNA-binding transcriptional regulator [Schaalia sp. 19OD2882]|uniref:LacI family DNA-binding transcriptional regulator n=1 Tax=Schaalia sp. 19OD2882 TaxID=2794089 RepID=UPI00265A9844|nr:LacI family DNA-binding transcriptional regulator [Schaalia sp. 19OD2882]